MANPSKSSLVSLRNPPPSNSSSSQVRVVLRVRPFLPSEIDASKETNAIPCVTVLDRQPCGEVTVHLKDQWTSRNECYKLDSFFSQEDHVGHIFDKEVSAVIPGIFEGLNATVFAYGATGSGKTYTMQGTANESGLIPLAMSTILSLRENTQFSVKMSYFEVYMDRCYDLLEPKAKEIMALDDKDGRVQLKGLSWAPVCSMDEFCEIYSTGVQRRKVAHTGLNDISSRSHAVLAVAVTNGGIKGKLNLIDLAGNEDNRRTCNEGIRLQESAKINQSLFALSNVIYALNNNEPRIPYRESKLTRILQDSLGGTSRALMIACLNPVSYPEAVHTVSLAARSRQIVNYVGSSSKQETPKVKVDMEAKLRAWLESKGKAKSIQRMGGLFSPSQGKTPTSLSYSKQPGSVRSSAKTSTMDQSVSKSKKKILFDSVVSNSAMENIKPSELDTKDVSSSLNEIVSSPHMSEVGKAETITSNLKIVESPDQQGTPFKDKLQSMGSLPGSERLKGLQNSDRKVLSPISSNILQTTYRSTSDSTCPILLEPKTPRTTHNEDEIEVGATPLDKFNAQSSNLKESLAQEYLAFLNAASKEELMQLKGIGQKRAEYILELREHSPRPLKSLSDLEKIGLSSRCMACSEEQLEESSHDDD
ncbi:kinesin-like protein KIN-10C isoform X2 [Typha latifolia]|uniref:kinesin-like protein KIN-10C isoform X2 n=1 Tax=Typha latifolia TaxID=4733 RepID=UPI003C302A73